MTRRCNAGTRQGRGIERWRNRFLALGLSALGLSAPGLSGCLATSAERAELATRIAEPAGLSRTTVEAGGFILTGYVRLSDRQAPVHVYIEGDGFPWETRSEISSDPTPLDPLALRLATVDPAPNVLYLARPCHYRPPGSRDACEPAYWTNRRFAENVIVAMNGAIDRILPAPHSEILLIGYSGGGGVAALVAARRTDVQGLMTVAGNLAHGAWTRHHDVSPLTGSLDPGDVAAGLSSLPQTHFVGAGDRIVPRLIADTYARKSGNGACVKIVMIEGASHHDGWTERWPDLIRSSPQCRTGNKTAGVRYGIWPGPASGFDMTS